MRLLHAFIVSFLSSFLALCLFTPSASDSAEIYPRERERAKILKEIERFTKPKLYVDHRGDVGARKRALLEIYQNEYWPHATKIDELLHKSVLLTIAFDRGLYNDQAEANAWLKERKDADNQIHELTTSVERQDILRRMADAARGLVGPVADFARIMHDVRESSGFSADELPILNRIEKLETEVRKIANKNAFNRGVGAHNNEYFEIGRKFREGLISFEDATTGREALKTSSWAAMGQHIATRCQPYFEEIAILRTQLAKSKGFANWAEYRMAELASYYAKGYKTPQQNIRFLRTFLEQTKDTHRDFLLQRAQEMNGIPDGLKTGLEKPSLEQSALLAAPMSFRIAAYFPVENVEKIWKRTMCASGFSSEAIRKIPLDSYPRSGKRPNDSLWNVRAPKPVIVRVDARDMTISAPGRWTPALVYLLQNLRSDGLDAYMTAFHEGGHGFDFTHREDLFEGGQASSYDETHSILMEKFFDDREFLLAIGKKRNGQRITADMVDEYLTNSTLNDLGSVRETALQALIDFEVWNYAYEAGGEDFVSRLARLDGELTNEYFYLHPETVINGIDLRYYSFHSNLIYGGNLANIGYFYAEIAARMSHDRLLDVLEEKTGRRTLYNQPDLANLLIEGYYKNGFSAEFPISIEQFSGTKFSTKKATTSLLRPVQAWLASRNNRTCESLFTTTH